MTDKELRGLNRAELLEILISLSKENEELREKVGQLTEQLNDRQIALSKAGSIAEAALALNGVFETAQRAAEQYMDNIKNNNQITDAESIRYLPSVPTGQVNEEAQSITAQAKSEAETILNEAHRNARRIIMSAKTESLRKEKNAFSGSRGCFSRWKHTGQQIMKNN